MPCRAKRGEELQDDAKFSPNRDTYDKFRLTRHEVKPMPKKKREEEKAQCSICNQENPKTITSASPAGGPLSREII